MLTKQQATELQQEFCTHHLLQAPARSGSCASVALISKGRPEVRGGPGVVPGAVPGVVPGVRAPGPSQRLVATKTWPSSD